jgi:hypothetical protein
MSRPLVVWADRQKRMLCTGRAGVWNYKRREFLRERKI